MTKVGEHITLDIIGTTKEYDSSVFEKVIKSIDPQNVLDRGYSLIINEEGSVIKDSAQISEGEEITAKLAKGSFGAKVGKKND